MNNSETGVYNKKIKSDYFTELIYKKIKGTAGYVIFFGIFTATCIVLQCLDNLFDIYYPGVFIFNKNFAIPMDLLTTLYATLCCVYIGVDRSSSIIATLKGSKNIQNFGNPERNKHIIIQNFFICSLSIILNRFFDANLGLEALLTSFGGSIILYVAGQKLVFQASKFAPPEVDKNHSGIDDRIEANKELIGVLNCAMANSENFKVYYIKENDDGTLKEELQYSSLSNCNLNNQKDTIDDNVE